MELKQVILVRQDLKLPKGKLGVQASHASVEAVLKSSKDKVNEWREQGMKKVIVKVEDEKQLLYYQNLAKNERLVASLITDAGRTIVEPGTKTCVGIGPDDEQKIGKITKDLKMV